MNIFQFVHPTTFASIFIKADTVEIAASAAKTLAANGSEIFEIKPIEALPVKFDDGSPGVSMAIPSEPQGFYGYLQDGQVSNFPPREEERKPLTGVPLEGESTDT